MGLLKGISPVISPDLLRALAMMGHGDDIVLADAHFPAHSVGREGAIVIRADGIGIPELLDAILQLIELDTYVYSPVTLMEVAEQDRRKGLVVSVWKKYSEILDSHSNENSKPLSYLERFDFYERAKNAFCIVQTGETAKYGNIILKNGLVTKSPDELSTSLRSDSRRESVSATPAPENSN